MKATTNLYCLKIDSLGVGHFEGILEIPATKITEKQYRLSKNEIRAEYVNKKDIDHGKAWFNTVKKCFWGLTRETVLQGFYEYHKNRIERAKAQIAESEKILKETESLLGGHGEKS